MHKGYVKIWRKVADNGLIGNAEVCQLFLFLMVKATHKPRKIIVGAQVIALQPGQYFAGRKQLAHELGSSERKIRTALSTLQKMEIIDQQATSKGTVISLRNWGKYQDERPAPDQHFDQDATSARPASDQHATTKQAFKAFNTEAHKGEGEESYDSSCPGSGEPDEQNGKSAADSRDDKKIPPARVKKPKAELPSDSEAYRLAEFMRDELTRELPTFKPPDLQAWAKDFDIALRNDRRMENPRFVAQVIRWVAGDSFWRCNCQSPGKLRKQFDQLTAKMESESARARASPHLSQAQRRVEQNKAACEEARELLFGKKENTHAGI